VKQLRADVEINSNPKQVWDIIINFNEYQKWNPFIRKIIGEAKVGSKILIHVKTQGGKNRKYEPTVTKVQEGRELRWFGGGLFLNGEHIFTIEMRDSGRILFVQRQVFEGLLSSFFGQSSYADIAAGLIAMNMALKERAERTRI